MNDDVQIQWQNISKNFSKAVIRGRRKGMNKVATEIKKTTKQLVKSSLPKAASSNSKYSDKMIDAVRTTKYKESTLVGEAIAGVHIMGTRKTGSGTFRLRFFEAGTSERFVKTHKRKGKNGTYTVKGHSTGKVDGKWFFKSAVNSRINEAEKIIADNIRKALENI